MASKKLQHLQKQMLDMEPQELFRMILSVDSGDRVLAEGIIDNLIQENEYLTLNSLYNLLTTYENYPGYDIVVDKERIEEKIEGFLKAVQGEP